MTEPAAGPGGPARRGAAAVAASAGVLLAARLAGTTPWRPVPGERRALPAVLPALEAADGDFTDEERERAAALRRDLLPGIVAGPLVGLGIALTLGLTPAGAALVRAVSRLLPRSAPVPLAAAAGGLATLAMGSAATLPVSYRTHRVLRRHGLSTQDTRAWAADVGKAGAIGSTVAGAGLALLSLATRRYPATWPAHLAVGAAGATVAGALVAPVVIEPIFLRFDVLPDGPARDAVGEVARTAGVPVREVLVADASRRTTVPNAYVSGLGRTRRVVLFDTLVEAMPPAEVGLVVAHELGHVRHRDVPSGTLTAAVGAAALCGLLGLALSDRRLLAAAGAAGAGDPAAVPLALATGALASALARPLMAAVSRRVEARADVFSLDITRDPATMAAMERRLAVAARAHPRPNPVLYLLRATHPSTVQRIAIARGWAARHGLAVPGPLAPSYPDPVGPG